MQLGKRTEGDEGHKGAVAINRAEGYDVVGDYIAEIYDQTETQRDDVALIKSLVGGKTAKILEPFCGHGRILIPLAEAGHEIMGMDLSDRLLRSLDARLRQLPDNIQVRASFRKSDVIAEDWPTGFDVVIMGANCFYELATPEEQEHCIEKASGALVSGGFLFLDNDHMEGQLDLGWCKPGIRESGLSGICCDGTRVIRTRETVWYDAELRLVRFRNTVEITRPDGETVKQEWMQQKHPPSTVEMRAWLAKHGFIIEELWGDRHRTPYSDESGRAIFWAKKPVKKES